MSRYIDKDKALEFVLTYTPHINGETTMKCVGRAIREIPTADVVEVVRCKDCEHWHCEGYDPILERVCGTCQAEYSPTFDYKEVSENDYCSGGRRRE